ncbi:MAG: DUF2279 domain-containing protein [Flavobacteriia bacterium]|nr:DUF2279 domain-containing protein [Flavobacteriia bacterium]
MRCKLVFFFYFFLIGFVFNQNQICYPSDTLSKKRFIASSSIITSTWIGGTIALNNIWYSNFSTSKFHVFNDSKEWLQMDKTGHLYTTNKLAVLISNNMKWCGIKPLKAVVIGSSVAFGFQTTLEILDGKSNGWGFSWSDMTANTTGLILFSSQELMWKEQRIILKFSAHHTPYAQLRPDVLGHNFQERLLKDYNGQSYWMSFNLKSFIPRLNIPPWICFALGYSIDQKIIGNQNTYFEPTSGQTLYASRKFLFSLDIDFSKIPIKNRCLKSIIRQFNYIKIPFPTLIFSHNKFSGHGFYF